MKTYAETRSPHQQPGPAQQPIAAGTRTAHTPRDTAQLQRQAQANTHPRENRTGMPDRLLSRLEAASGFDMTDVRVHRNSAKPALLNAYAYAQGTNIYLGPGQERHLPHEAWHVVQQKQGRVRATRQFRGVGVNDDVVLEREAGEVGNGIYRRGVGKTVQDEPSHTVEQWVTDARQVVQRLVIVKAERHEEEALPAAVAAKNTRIREVMIERDLYQEKVEAGWDTQNATGTFNHIIPVDGYTKALKKMLLGETIGRATQLLKGLDDAEGENDEEKPLRQHEEVIEKLIKEVIRRDLHTPNNVYVGKQGRDSTDEQGEGYRKRNDGGGKETDLPEWKSNEEKTAEQTTEEEEVRVREYSKEHREKVQARAIEAFKWSVEKVVAITGRGLGGEDEQWRTTHENIVYKKEKWEEGAEKKVDIDELRRGVYWGYAKSTNPQNTKVLRNGVNAVKALIKGRAPEEGKELKQIDGRYGDAEAYMEFIENVAEVYKLGQEEEKNLYAKTIAGYAKEIQKDREKKEKKENLMKKVEAILGTARACSANTEQRDEVGYLGKRESWEEDEGACLGKRERRQDKESGEDDESKDVVGKRRKQVEGGEWTPSE